MKYGVVATREDIKLNLLVKRVNELIAEGWEPLGGVSVSVTHHAIQADEYFYVQAVIRRNPCEQLPPHPQAASIRALGEEDLKFKFYDEPVAEVTEDGHLRLTETGHAIKGADWICPDDCEYCGPNPELNREARGIEAPDED